MQEVTIREFFRFINYYVGNLTCRHTEVFHGNKLVACLKDKKFYIKN